MIAALLPGWPLAGAALLAVLPAGRVANLADAAAAAATLALACLLPELSASGWMRADPLAVAVAALVGFISLMASGRGGFASRRHVLVGLLLLATLAADTRVAAVAVLAAALAASWLARGWSAGAGRRVLLVTGASAALALAGSALLAGNRAEPTLGLVLVLAGYGGLAGLLPPGGWLATAALRAPDGAAMLLAGAMPCVPLVLLLRLRQEQPELMPLLVAVGLTALLLAAVGLWRSRPAGRRMLALATAAQGGVAAVAFGLGGPAATFAGLLHLLLAALGRSAACRGLGTSGPYRKAALLALSGLPPFGPFSSLILVLWATIGRAPLLALPLGIGAVLAMAGVLRHSPEAVAVRPAGAALLRLAPAWLPLAAAAVLGLAMPGTVLAWLRAAVAG
ncbi:MAG TPA: hypothetical protein VHY76_12695 [Acetobacteraceae bacterium]|nr:hypothetical protein [Acetobacteraceae bacterium]